VDIFLVRDTMLRTNHHAAQTRHEPEKKARLPY